MNKTFSPWFVFVFFATVLILFSATSNAQSGAWLTHSHDEQHTALSTVAAQPLSSIHWHTPVDLHPPQGEIFIHYGSPLVTAANTVIIPVKTGANSFSIEAKNGATGSSIWAQATGYQAPSAAFTPAMGPTISGNTLYIPDIAGRILVRPNPDQAKMAFKRLYFLWRNKLQQEPNRLQAERADRHAPHRRCQRQSLFWLPGSWLDAKQSAKRARSHLRKWNRYLGLGCKS